jgi:hypothetical protein
VCGGVCVCVCPCGILIGSFTVFGGVMLDLCVGLCDDLRVHGLHACGFVVHSGEEDMRVCGGVCSWCGPQARPICSVRGVSCEPDVPNPPTVVQHRAWGRSRLSISPVSRAPVPPLSLTSIPH